MISTLPTIYTFLCHCAYRSPAALHPTVLGVSLRGVLQRVASVPSPSEELMMLLMVSLPSFQSSPFVVLNKTNSIFNKHSSFLLNLLSSLPFINILFKLAGPRNGYIPAVIYNVK